MTSTQIRPGASVRHARAAVFALFFTNGALFANLIPRYPEIKDTFALSDTAYGVTIALFPLGAICSGPLAARFIRRFSSARTAALGTVLIGACLSIVGAITMWRASMGADADPSAARLAHLLFVLVFFLGGASDSITDVGQNAHALRVQRHYGRSIISSFHGGWSLGAVTGGLMGAGAVALHLPLGWHMVGAAVLFIVVGLVALRFTLPGPDEDRSAGEAGAARADAVGAAEGEVGGDAGGADMRVRTLALPATTIIAVLTVLSISGTLVEDAASTWSTLYMRDYLGVLGGLAAMAYVVMLASQAVGRLTADRIIDALGARSTVRIGGLLVAAGMGMAVAWPSPATTLVGMVAAGVGCASIVPIAMNAADDIPGMRPGVGLTIVTWLMRLAFLVSPPLVGMLVEATSLRSAMAVMPAAGLVTILSAWILRPRGRGPAAPPSSSAGAETSAPTAAPSPTASPTATPPSPRPPSPGD